jgi:hypothetical protein
MCALTAVSLQLDRYTCALAAVSLQLDLCMGQSHWPVVQCCLCLVGTRA